LAGQQVEGRARFPLNGAFGSRGDAIRRLDGPRLVGSIRCRRSFRCRHSGACGRKRRNLEAQYDGCERANLASSGHLAAASGGFRLTLARNSWHLLGTNGFCLLLAQPNRLLENWATNARVERGPQGVRLDKWRRREERVLVWRTGPSLGRPAPALAASARRLSLGGGRGEGRGEERGGLASRQLQPRPAGRREWNRGPVAPIGLLGRATGASELG